MTPVNQAPMWQRLFIQTPPTESAAISVKSWLASQAYVAYDPFAGGLGAPIKLKDRLKMFLSPPLQGWSMLILSPQDTLPPEALTAIGTTQPILNLLIYPDGLEIQAKTPASELVDGPAALHLLWPDADKISAMWQAVQASSTEAGHEPPTMDNAIRNIVAGEQGGSQGWLTKKMTNRFLKQATQGLDENPENMREQAQAMFKDAPVEVSWSREDIGALVALLATVDFPQGWHLPHWKTLNAAYTVARQHAYRPNAPMLPGDQQALDAVPHALDFELFFFARAQPS